RGRGGPRSTARSPRRRGASHGPCDAPLSRPPERRRWLDITHPGLEDRSGYANLDDERTGGVSDESRATWAAPADLVLTNGRIWTGLDGSESGGATAIAITGDTIVAVGADADAAEWTGPRTRVVDLGGRRVIPG